jgi:cell division transport system permease protein
MPVSVDYVARETASNLWRNRLMTIAAILTVAVSLTLVGAALLLRQGAANASGVWERGNRVTVWMNPGASAQEIQGVKVQLAQLNYVHQTCDYWNKERNFTEARKLLPSDEFQATTVSDMVTSFWCTPVALSDSTQFIRAETGAPGVLTVSAPLQTIRTEEKVINVLKWVFLGLAVILIVSAAVLILNSIRMAIFARRREVSVMKLVGATNWFIRVPFMSEGLVQGIVGSGLAAAAVYGLYLVINHYGGGAAGNGNFLSDLQMTSGEAILTDVVVVFVGAIIGSLGSAIAIRRFLDV